MNSLPSIALSGLNAAWMGVSVSAHNIANAQTEGFHRQVLEQQTVEGGGVTVTLSQAPEAGEALIDDVVQQMAASYSFQANVLTLKTADRMMGSLLDILA